MYMTSQYIQKRHLLSCLPCLFFCDSAAIFNSFLIALQKKFSRYIILFQKHEFELKLNFKILLIFFSQWTLASALLLPLSCHVFGLKRQGNCAAQQFQQLLLNCFMQSSSLYLQSVSSFVFSLTYLSYIFEFASFLLESFSVSSQNIQKNLASLLENYGVNFA